VVTPFNGKLTRYEVEELRSRLRLTFPSLGGSPAPGSEECKASSNFIIN